MVPHKETTFHDSVPPSLAQKRAGKMGRPHNPAQNRIGEMMERRGMRPLDLMTTAGLSQTKIYKILNNKMSPSEMDLLYLARALGCHPRDLRD